MKWYSRMTTTNECMIPRKTIFWIIMSMTLLSMVFLIATEVRRILSMGALRNNAFDGDIHLEEDNRLNRTDEIHFRGMSQEQDNDVTRYLQTKHLWNGDDIKNENNDSDIIEAVFEDHPHCRDKPYLLILVPSGPANFERREAIRKSWASSEDWKLNVSGLKSKTLFLVGRTTTKILNILLKTENDITGDIVFGDYLDTYRNLTTKVVHGFSWAARHCKPSYLLKTDDDCFVNVPLLLQFLSKYNPVPDNLYVGMILWWSPVIRDPNSRWYVSKTEYPKPRYAPYALGLGYILSYDVLEKFVYFSDKVHMLPNEDAYVGTVLETAGVRPTYSERFALYSGAWQSCDFQYLFIVHNVKASRQNEYKDQANIAAENCSLEHTVTDWV